MYRMRRPVRRGRVGPCIDWVLEDSPHPVVRAARLAKFLHLTVVRTAAYIALAIGRDSILPHNLPNGSGEIIVRLAKTVFSRAGFAGVLIPLSAIVTPLQRAHAADASKAKTLEWRVLLIVKAKGDIRADGFPDVKYEMNPVDIAAVKAAFAEYTPTIVKDLSNGRLVWKPDVVISPTSLTKVAKLGDGNWVGPECVATDIEKHAPLGKYDGVFVYWKDTDDKTRRSLKGGFGWSIGPTEAAGGCGFSCVNFVPAKDFTRESEWTEVFIHEWLHQLEAFYGSNGVKLPRGGLHGNDNYGFKHKNGWKHWYNAFINAELTEKDGTHVGLGESAWRRGTIRDELAVRLPEYLTPDRRRANLLTEGSFEGTESAKNWLHRSWRGNNKILSIVHDVTKAGKAAARLQSSVGDDALLYQKIAVKPKTRYLLCGWIRTDKVVIDQKGGAVGANLSVAGGFESSRSVVGTNDWTYATLVFSSGERKEIEVGGRLGHHGSVALGTAWFDDLVLIELPHSAPMELPK